MPAGFSHEPVVDLSERLARATGGALGHCFYASDGASAVEIALKMSFHYWRNGGRPEKRCYVALEGGYHGETLGALSVSDVALFRDAYAPLLRQGATVPSPDWRNAEPGEAAIVDLGVGLVGQGRRRDRCQRERRQQASGFVHLFPPTCGGREGKLVENAFTAAEWFVVPAKAGTTR